MQQPTGFTLEVSFDLPTLQGHDSDHPLAEGEVGKAGVPIDSLEDMQTLFKGIRLDEVSISMNIDAAGFILLAFYAVLARQQGVDWKKLSGNMLQQDAVRRTYIYPPQHSMRIDADVLEWCSRELPCWNLISVSAIDSQQDPVPVPPVDDLIRQVQIQKLETLRRRRDPARVDTVLQDLNDKAASGENIMPVVVEAIERRCTLGEIADTLREVFGEYKQPD
jgi:methylmalonyl-CoA mutase N-terminal domain/subunit